LNLDAITPGPEHVLAEAAARQRSEARP